MTQDYELVVKGVRNFENKVTVTVALQDKERFDGEIFDLDVAMDRVEGAALEFYEAAARRSVRQVFLEVAEKLSEKVESYLQHQYSFKIENPANKHELNRPGFPGECFICELRLPDHRFRWKHNKLFLLLPVGYGPAFPAIVDCYTSPPT
ncbi:hypothetical protein A1WI_03617 [Escherichia coli KTE98]|nr:hypothetical protein A1WI_03617 [Escherichia coli KTE98]